MMSVCEFVSQALCGLRGQTKPMTAARLPERLAIAFPLRWVSWVLAIGLVACGGGGDTTSNPPDAAAVLTVQPVSQAASSGDGVTFSVVATGVSLTFQWQRRNSATANWADIVGAIAASYSLAIVDSSMNGNQFRAVVKSGSATTTSADATLTVTPPPAPVISTQPVNQSTTVGGNATFSAVVNGSSVRYQWQASSDGGATWSTLSNATSDTLVQAALSLSDSGRLFRVIATNDGGTATSSAAVLTVSPALAAPAITSQPENASMAATRTATLVVAASGNPAPTYQWQRSTDGGVLFADVPGASSASYTTPTLALTDSGTRYRATVSNSQGSVVSNAAVLTVTSATGPGFTQAVLAMGTTTCAVKPDGTGWCWGASEDGQVNGTVLFVARDPVPMQGLAGAIGISTGLGHTCAARSNGSAVCWGRNSYGEIGSGLPVGGFQQIFGPRVVSGLSGVKAVVTGSFFSCALRSDGTVACWGYNGSGQVGDGTSIDRTDATTVPGLSNATALSAGDTHTCALRSDGTVACWGYNNEGQLGDGTRTLRRSPMTVPGLSGVIAIAAGSWHTCALKADGSVACWGDANGATGSFTATLSPRQMAGLTNVAAIAASDYNTCALKLNGTVLCWGDGAGLGTGLFQPNTTNPVVVPGLTNVVALAGGYANMCAVGADGSLRCWGSNLYGQIGDGTNDPSRSPKLIPGFTVLMR